MTSGLAAVPATAPERRPWAELLREAIRPVFGVDVYVADASDPVLFGARCAVGGCPARGAHHVKRDHYLCRAHGKQWRADGRPDVQRWVRVGARPLKTLAIAMRCQARECPRSVFYRGLCYPHFGRWKLAGRPEQAAWAATAEPANVRHGRRCRLQGCRFPAMGKRGFCDTHNMHFAHLRASDPAATPADLLARAAQRRVASAPRATHPRRAGARRGRSRYRRGDLLVRRGKGGRRREACTRSTSSTSTPTCRRSARSPGESGALAHSERPDASSAPLYWLTVYW